LKGFGVCFEYIPFQKLPHLRQTPKIAEITLFISFCMNGLQGAYDWGFQKSRLQGLQGLVPQVPSSDRSTPAGSAMHRC